MARPWHWRPARRLELVAAALAANLALVPVADQLNASSRVLSEPQRQVIRKHPERAVQALQAAGLDRPTLTRIIAQHHERFDGDGYPLGLTGHELLPEAETLALAERYVAMVTRRAYRERLSIHAARQAITGLAGRASRPAVARALLDVLGEYPPGVLVRLASREIGVVTRQQGQPRSPVVMALSTPRGSATAAALNGTPASRNSASLVRKSRNSCRRWISVACGASGPDCLEAARSQRKPSAWAWWSRWSSMKDAMKK